MGLVRPFTVRPVCGVWASVLSTPAPPARRRGAGAARRVEGRAPALAFVAFDARVAALALAGFAPALRAAAFGARFPTFAFFAFGFGFAALAAAAFRPALAVRPAPVARCAGVCFRPVPFLLFLAM
jgi:hypothetical protein